MKAYCKMYLSLLMAGAIGFMVSCSYNIAGSVYEVTINDDVQENFRAGETPSRNLFQYGQENDNALDILLPLDPSGTRSIAKSHVYYLTKGSKVRFNIETLADFATYSYDEDLEDRGEIFTPRQLISMCTGANPVTGALLKDSDGDDANITETSEYIGKKFVAYLKQCTSGVTNFRDFSTRGPFVYNCRSFQFGGSNDPFRGQNYRTTALSELCKLGAEFTINEHSGFSQELRVSSYNNSSIRFETKEFSNPISPHIFAVGDEIITLRVKMTPDEDNSRVVNGTAGNEQHLRYEWTMPADENGIWQANFASDIKIAYVRFYWSDRSGRRLPIVHDPRSGLSPHKIQVNVGNVCRNPDNEGYFRANDCRLFVNNTPATSKLALDAPITWKMSIIYDDHNYEMIGSWGFPVVMEFGIKAE